MRAESALAHDPVKLWRPKRVLITPAARELAHGRGIAERAASLGAEIVELSSNRLTGLVSGDPRRAYRDAKSTLAVVIAPPSKRKLQPIPPSADWRFDLAEGCPAHCQYCYLAGSLSGPPITRVYANLEEILDGLVRLCGTGPVTSASRARADEGTTYAAAARLSAMRRVAVAGYPIGLTIAPIMPEGDWREAYTALLRQVASTLAGAVKYVYPKELMKEMREFFKSAIAQYLRARGCSTGRELAMP